MTSYLKWIKHSYVKTATLIFVMIAALISIGYGNELKQSDWGTWVGSVGTVATLMGTIVLARQETTRRHRQERDAAIISAGFMNLALIGYSATLTSVIADLKQPIEDDLENPWRELARRLEACPVWTREDLQPLIYLENHVAANLAVAQESVRLARELLIDAANGKATGELDLLELSDLNNEVLNILEHALPRVDVAWDSCDLLLKLAR